MAQTTKQYSVEETQEIREETIENVMLTWAYSNLMFFW